MDRHTSLFRCVPPGPVVDHRDALVDLGPSEYRRLTDVALVGTQDLSIVDERSQLRQTIAGDDFQPFGAITEGEGRIRAAEPRPARHLVAVARPW